MITQAVLDFDPSARKHGGNAESVAAHARAQVFKRQMYEHILNHLEVAGAAGLTSKQIARYLGVELNTVSGRFSELKRSGHIAQRDEVRDGAKVLVITEKGRRR